MQLNEREALTYGWTQFTEHVRHESRYVFMVAVTQTETWDDPLAIPPGRMLDEIGRILNTIDLSVWVPAGSRVWRARSHPNETTLTSASDLGSPPIEYTVSTRMAGAGISMFYGASDETTAIEEVKAHLKDGDQRAITCGQFVTARDMWLLDLTRLPDVPSIFDERRRNLRPVLLFLHHFASEMSKPLASLGREDVEYVPTQIVTDFVRHLRRTPSGERYKGIVYRSAAHFDGTSYVLFVDDRGCCDLASGWENNSACWLALDPATVRQAQ